MDNQSGSHKVRLYRKFSFETAHFLPHYQGDCQRIHGHSYHLEVGVLGTPLSSPNHPNDGMVIDSCELKKIVKEQVLDVYDHRLIVNATQQTFIQSLNELGMKLVVTNFQPTIENLVLEFVSILKTNLPKHLQLCVIKLHETDNTYSEWNASDN